jgi:hypothetical protein
MIDPTGIRARFTLLNRVWFESGSSRGVGEAARIPI